MKKFIYFSLALVCSIMTLAKEIHFRLLTGKIDFCFPNFGSYSLDVELSAPGSGDGSKGLYSFQDSFDRVSKSGGRHLRPYEAFSILISGLHLRFSDGSDLAMIKNDMYNGGEWLDAGFVPDRASIKVLFGLETVVWDGYYRSPAKMGAYSVYSFRAGNLLGGPNELRFVASSCPELVALLYGMPFWELPETLQRSGLLHLPYDGEAFPVWGAGLLSLCAIFS